MREEANKLKDDIVYKGRVKVNEDYERLIGAEQERQGEIQRQKEEHET